MADVNDIDLEAVIEATPVGRTTLAVLMLASLALIFDGFDIQAIALIAPRLLADWGLSKADLSGVLAAGLIGMAVGALGIGELGDRYGRRRAVVLCLSIIAVTTLGAARAPTLAALGAWRFLAGIGLGGALPNATALVLEYSTRRVRNLAVAITVVGVPVGGLLGALVVGPVMAMHGWRGVFVLGAVLPALLAVAAFLALPESPRYLAIRRDAWARGHLATLMNRLVGASRYNGTEQWVVAGSDDVRHGFRELYRPEYRFNTLMLLLVFLTNLLSVYSYFNWTPTLLSGAGLTLPNALRGSLWFNIGGVVGALGGAAAMNRLGSRAVLGVLGALSVLSTYAIGQLPIGAATDLLPLYACLTVAGGAISGLQVNMYTVAANAYPTHLRATGVGAALASARSGAIFSAFTGTFLLRFGHGIEPFFSGIALVLVVTLAAALALRCHLAPTHGR